ncbi:MAG: hypothetical protein AB8I80_10905 [Anaerolineae bacterium]
MSPLRQRVVGQAAIRPVRIERAGSPAGGTYLLWARESLRRAALFRGQRVSARIM